MFGELVTIIINFKFRKYPLIYYGSIPLNKFAPIVHKLEDIRKNMSSKFIKAVKESQKKTFFETKKRTKRQNKGNN